MTDRLPDTLGTLVSTVCLVGGGVDCDHTKPVSKVQKLRKIPLPSAKVDNSAAAELLAANAGEQQRQ